MPVIAVHQSGHFGVANSKALELAGVTADTPDPPGGIIRRGADGEPDGVLEENAFISVVSGLLGSVGEEGFKAFARAGAEPWARYGYTTGQEGRAFPVMAEVLRAVADEGGLPIDVAVYGDVLIDREYVKENLSDDYVNHLRVAA
jgi:predicted amidohydrolase YtcJ